MLYMQYFGRPDLLKKHKMECQRVVTVMPEEKKGKTKIQKSRTSV